MSAKVRSASQYREMMQARIERARRVFGRLRPLLQTARAKDSAEETGNQELVGDEFSHFIAELKIVRHYFAEWWESVGRKKPNTRIDEWRDRVLKDASATTAWDALKEIRDADVHRAPVRTARVKRSYVLRTATKSIALVTMPYVATYQDRSGNELKLTISQFCAKALEVTEKFATEFDGMY